MPDEMLSGVIDLARANSVIVKAGAVSIKMGSDNLTLARVRTDPTFATRIENAEITETDIVFDKLNLVAHNFGALIKCSRELAADAPNFSALVTGTLSRAFAAKLDYVAINGTTSTHPSGVLQWGTDSGVTETTSVGAIAWEDLHNAATSVRETNYEPSGYIVHPTIAGDLDILTTGDGTNSAKQWLGAPPSLEGVTRYGTTNCPTSSIVVGDWSQFAIGIRQGAMIEVSTQRGDAFSKHQVHIKLSWRGDFAAFRRNAFHRLVGITT